MSNAVNHPPHYQGNGGIEAIDVIEALVGIDGHAANAIKYILRHRHKGRAAEDLAKARWYINRLRTSGARIAKRDTPALRTIDGVASAFDLTGAARHALEDLVAALTSVGEDRYRAYLSSAAAALGRAIAANGAQSVESGQS